MTHDLMDVTSRCNFLRDDLRAWVSLKFSAVRVFCLSLSSPDVSLDFLPKLVFVMNVVRCEEIAYCSLISRIFLVSLWVEFFFLFPLS